MFIAKGGNWSKYISETSKGVPQELVINSLEAFYEAWGAYFEHFSSRFKWPEQRWNIPISNTYMLFSDKGWPWTLLLKESNGFMGIP